MVAEKVNDSRGFGLFDDIRAYAPTHQFKGPGERNPALLSVTPGYAIALDDSS